MKKTICILSLLAFVATGAYAAPMCSPKAKTSPMNMKAKSGALMCPVLNAPIKDKAHAPKSVYKGKTYYFCCPPCKTKFDKNPAKYIKSMKIAPKPKVQPQGQIKCPILGTPIKDIKHAPKSVYKGKTYYFCCPPCKASFDKNPEHYLKGK